VSGGYEPTVVVVARGDSVVIVNRDSLWHQPFSVSKPLHFGLGAMAPGQRRAMRCTRSGVVRVFCRLHSSEPSANVLVAPNATWAHPDATGAFALPALPPGRYELRFWHPRYGERRWRVDLPRRGISLELGL